jgi:ADP-ribose pyrophosphatase
MSVPDEIPVNDEPSAGSTRVGRIASRSVFKGRILDVREDEVRYPDGSVGTLEVIRHQGAAAVLPVYRPGEWCGGTGAAVVLLRQYRYAAGRTLWEIPAGRLDSGESPVDCARRELEEEAGLRAREMRRLTTLFTTPGFTDEVIHLFVASGLEEGSAAPEEHEFLERHEMPLEEAMRLVRDGLISDGKTVCALLMAAAFPDRGTPDTELGNNDSSPVGV